MNKIQKLKENVKNIRVLFVDDEGAVRKQTGVFLQKFFTHVTICENGEEALDAFKNGNFNLLITDSQMPKMDGNTLIQEVRKIDKTLFIVLLTALREIEKSSSEMVNIVLNKPLSFEHIINMLESLDT